ncbi:MAG: DoxX family protein [Hyphomicrobium sp. SCN 65-11]|nr:MAG: DoxX family protein [Hyphomicrobium sp. SCN 65-11]
MSADFSSPVPAAGLAIGRLLLAALFLLEGWSKLRGYDAAVAYMNRFGVPGALLPAVIALELGGGLMIAVGWQTRLAAAALAAFCILTAVMFHGNVADRSQILHFEKDLAIAGGFLVLTVAGAGRWSVDHAAGR